MYVLVLVGFPSELLQLLCQLIIQLLFLCLLAHILMLALYVQLAQATQRRLKSLSP